MLKQQQRICLLPRFHGQLILFLELERGAIFDAAKFLHNEGFGPVHRAIQHASILAV